MLSLNCIQITEWKEKWKTGKEIKSIGLYAMRRWCIGIFRVRFDTALYDTIRIRVCNMWKIYSYNRIPNTIHINWERHIQIAQHIDDVRYDMTGVPHSIHLQSHSFGWHTLRWISCIWWCRRLLYLQYTPKWRASTMYSDNNNIVLVHKMYIRKNSTHIWFT